MIIACFLFEHVVFKSAQCYWFNMCPQKKQRCIPFVLVDRYFVMWGVSLIWNSSRPKLTNKLLTDSVVHTTLPHTYEFFDICFTWVWNFPQVTKPQIYISFLFSSLFYTLRKSLSLLFLNLIWYLDVRPQWSWISVYFVWWRDGGRSNEGNFMENLFHVCLSFYDKRYNETNKTHLQDQTKNERLLSERKRVRVSFIIYRTVLSLFLYS